jgi:hypothetical protein
MSTHITITAAQRDALYEQALEHLSGIADLWTAITHEDFETADRLGLEFADELRLILHNLGWGYGPVEKEVELTLPTEDLHRIFARFLKRATSLREFEEQDHTEETPQRFRARSRLVTDACEQVLGVVSRIPPGAGRDRLKREP